MDPKTFDSRNKKLENDSRLLLKKNWRCELSIIRCNYDVKYIDGLPLFYKDILTFFSELKDLYCYYRMQDMVLFNDKEILVRGRPVFIKEWFDSNICPSETC